MKSLDRREKLLKSRNLRESRGSTPIDRVSAGESAKAGAPLDQGFFSQNAKPRGIADKPAAPVAVRSGNSSATKSNFPASQGVAPPVRSTADRIVCTHAVHTHNAMQDISKGIGFWRMGVPLPAICDAAHSFAWGVPVGLGIRSLFAETGSSTSEKLREYSENWLGNLDSNQDRRSQSPLFYH